MAVAGTRKRSREESQDEAIDFTTIDLEIDSAGEFAESMRNATKQNTLTHHLAAIERASEAAKVALVAQGGLRRFRQWFQELLEGSKISSGQSAAISDEQAAMLDYAFKVLSSMPTRSASDLRSSRLGIILQQLLEGAFKVPAAVVTSARSLLQHWADSGAMSTGVDTGNDTSSSAASDPRQIGTPSGGGNESDATMSVVANDDDEDDDDMDFLPPTVSLHGSLPSVASFDSAAATGTSSSPSPSSAAGAGNALSLLSMATPATSKEEPEKDHCFYDGRPSKFGKAAKGILINRKNRIVGGRPWAPREAVLGKPSKKVAVKVDDLPAEAVAAKQQRSKGIVFAEGADMTLIREFLKMAVPSAVSVGDPTEDDYRKVMEASDVADQTPDDADAVDSHDASAGRKREEDIEKSMDIRSRLRSSDDEGDAGSADAAAAAAARDKGAFATTHFHAPPPPLAIPASLHRPSRLTPHNRATNDMTALVTMYTERDPNTAADRPELAGSPWAGYDAKKQAIRFPSPKLRTSSLPSSSGGIAAMLAQLSADSVADEGRDASLSRRSASPGTALPASAQPAASGSTLSVLSRLSAILPRPTAESAKSPSTSMLAGLGNLAQSAAAPSLPMPAPATIAMAQPLQHHATGYAGGSTGYAGGSTGYAGGSTGYAGGSTGYAGGSTGYAGGSTGYAGAIARPPPTATAQASAVPSTYLAPAATDPLPPLGQFPRMQYDPNFWWHLLPEEMEPVRNTPNKGTQCHFFPTIQGCHMGVRCGFVHDPFWMPSRPPKGVDNNWARFIREVLPSRRARRAEHPQGGPPGSSPLSNGGKLLPGATGGAASAAAGYGMRGAGGGPSSYGGGSASAAGGYGGGSSYGGGNSYGAAGGYGGASAGRPSYGGASAGGTSGMPSYGNAGASTGGGYAYGAQARPPAPRPGGATGYQYGYGQPPAQRQAMGAPAPPQQAQQYGQRPLSGYAYGSAARAAQPPPQHGGAGGYGARRY